MRLISRQEAIELGAARYFTGKPCRNGHVAERQVSNRGCLKCHSSSMLRTRRENPEKRKAYLNSWRNERNYNAVWYERNKEKERERGRTKPKNHAAAAARAQRWRDNNPETYRATIARAHARRKNRTVAWVDYKQIEALYREAYRLTRDTGVRHHVDHILPLCGKRVSGLHVFENLRILPARVNLQKGNRLDSAALAIAPDLA